MTEAQSYYLSMDGNESNSRRDDRALIINCTGMAALSQSFTTNFPAGRDDYYLQYLCGGKMDVWIDGKRHLMSPGQAIFYYPRTEYHYAMHGSGEVRYYWAHFTGSGVEELMESCRLRNKTILDVGISESVVLDFEGIFREFIVRDACFPHLSAAKLTSLLVEIGRRAGYVDSAPSETDRRIYHSLAYIHKNFDRQLTVEQLASLVHLSVSRFRTLFRERTGLSPLDYLIILRINQARQMIMQTDMTVGEIADAVGYQDQLYFSRVFKKRTGYAPSGYKESFRADRD